MGQFEQTIKILPFFLDVIFQLFWQISRVFDTKYQMLSSRSVGDFQK